MNLSEPIVLRIIIILRGLGRKNLDFFEDTRNKPFVWQISPQFYRRSYCYLRQILELIGNTQADHEAESFTERSLEGQYYCTYQVQKLTKTKRLTQTELSTASYF